MCVLCGSAAATSPSQVLVRPLTAKPLRTPARCSRHGGRCALGLHGAYTASVIRGIGTAVQPDQPIFACCSSANTTNRQIPSSGVSVLCSLRRGYLRYVSVQLICCSALVVMRLSWAYIPTASVGLQLQVWVFGL